VLGLYQLVYSFFYINYLRKNNFKQPKQRHPVSTLYPAFGGKKHHVMDKNKYAVLLDNDDFGPKSVFVGDQVRFIRPNSTESILGIVLKIPSYSFVEVESKDHQYRGKIYRDRITAVFPKFK